MVLYGYGAHHGRIHVHRFRAYILPAKLLSPNRCFGESRFATYLVVHGIVLTAWFLLFFVQTLLIARDAPGIHRRLGVLGALLAVGVVVLGAVATLRAIPRLPDGTPIIIGNMVGLLMFSLFFVCGVYFRRRPATHKRFMLLASGNLIGPAFAPQRGIGRALPLPWGPIVVVAPLVALIMHDFLRYRLEAASLWGSLAMILGILLFATLMVSGAGAAFVRWLA